MSRDSGTPEQRKDPRVSIRVPIYVAAAGSVVRKTIRLESRDVSAGGLSFETGRELPLEAESQLLLERFDDLSSSVCIRGRVVWKTEIPGTGRFRVGVQFTDFEGITREELVSRMEAWSKIQR